LFSAFFSAPPRGGGFYPAPQLPQRNLAAVSLKLNADDSARLDRALAPEAISGPRYNAAMMARVDR